MTPDRVSDLTAVYVCQYIRLNTDPENVKECELVLKAAKGFVCSYTGLPEHSPDGESIDSYPDIVVAVLALCQDMYDNRSMYVESDKANKVVASILDMHSRNLL